MDTAGCPAAAGRWRTGGGSSNPQQGRKWERTLQKNKTSLRGGGKGGADLVAEEGRRGENDTILPGRV